MGRPKIPPYEFVCKYCNKVFYDKKHKDRNCCSHRCWKKWYFLQKGILGKTLYKKGCNFCGEEFESQRNNRKYCSLKCYWGYKEIFGKRYKGKRSKFFTQQLKDRVRVRDNFICQLCGVPELENKYRLSVHHIDYNYENCDIYNLVALCRRCHAKTETNSMREDFKIGFRTLLGVPQ